MGAALAVVSLSATTLAEDVLMSELPSDDSCSSDECALSLRQLRGEKIAAEVAKVGESDVPMVEESEDVTADANSTGNACQGQEGRFGSRAKFNADIYHCALSTGVDLHRGSVCMQNIDHLSTECSYCVGHLMKCGVGCAAKCCIGHCIESPTCRRCNEQRCYGAFWQCAGVTPP